VGLKRTENEEEKRRMWAHPVICDKRNNGLFWTIFEDLRRDGAKFVLECMWTPKELYETNE